MSPKIEPTQQVILKPKCHLSKEATEIEKMMSEKVPMVMD